MIETYSLLKLVHVTTAIVSICGFLLRGYWRFSGSAFAQHRLARILPHINDTVLLGCGVTMAILAGYNPLHHVWLGCKLLLLLGYIGCGMLAFRFARTHTIQTAAFVTAILFFAAIMAIAITKPV